ncbi:hypothetical protein MKW98_032270 [Papaver atlanticum]|uniref:RRM domain-containing protein n=1 Tax=Papaver atlanticum TaxID=357466 RepID=A0AAD4XDJ5_9MAGN|nr:hypothetical protein MKW98_032270 [Papaver atlanticum]
MGKPSKRSEVVAAVSHAFVNSGEGNNKKDANKRDAEENEIMQKLNLKKNKKFYEPESRAYASAKPVKRTAASKTLIASNLPVSIDKSHVIHFFKQVGDDIVDVRFYFYEGKDGYLRISFALVEFATEEAANKAIKLQRLDFLGYTVKLSPHLEGATGAASKRQLLSGSGHIEFVTEEGAKKAVRLNGVELLGSPIDLWREAKGTGASRTLCLKNVPLSIEKSHVIDFFENDGDIADMRLLHLGLWIIYTYNDNCGTFGRIVHVEFATEEAAKQAVKSNGRDLKGCTVELGICVQGFDTSSGIDQILIFLKRHFRTCKSIIHMDIPEDHTAGVPLGTAVIEFSSLRAFHRALDLDGQEVDGISLTIKDSVPV